LEVRISLGLMFFSMHMRIALAAFSHSLILDGEVAGVLAEPGSVSPRVSIMVARELAVYIPPQAPAPGQAFCSISDIISSGVCEGSSDHDWSVLKR
jgi:hypothetical protein